MEPSKEPINVRTKRIANHILGNTSNNEGTTTLITREGLLDALEVLYEECNSDCLKNTDKNIKKFVERHKKAISNLRRLRVNLSDFEVKNVIGRGHFGEVHLVKEKQTGDVYAMKIIKKYKSLEEKYGNFEGERDIMAFSASPWLTSLRYAFQDKVNLYFVMEYHPGGDLVGLLYRQGGTLPESAARFYIAELVVALHDLHAMGYVHRDVKPDNVLLDRCGHIKIVDFGSAAILNSNQQITDVIPVGTPDYIAPEILQSLDSNKKNKRNYGIASDYWSLGILGYELTVGNTPFNGPNTPSTYSKIMNYKNSLKFPPDIILTQGFVSLIKNLLTDEDHRLNYESILKHPVYKNLDFNSLRNQIPPYVPKVTSLDDTSNFIDIEYKKNEPHIDSFKLKTHFSGKNLPFIGFTYTPNVAIQNENLSRNDIVKDETILMMKKEIDKLQKKLSELSDFGEKESFEKRLDEKSRKLENFEEIRRNLEKDLAKSMTECSALKRKLDLERKDRMEVEKKALELIKSAKLKWEAMEKPKIEGLESEIRNHKEKVLRLEAEKKILADQLNQVGIIEDKHKASLQKVENLRRSSVVGLESRLQKVTNDSQKEVTGLQSKLSEEIKKNSNFQKIIHDYKLSNDELTEDLQNIKQKLETLKGQFRSSDLLTKEVDKHKSEIERYKKLLEESREDVSKLKSELQNANFLENKLRHEEETVGRIRQELKDLKTELNFEKISNKNTIEELQEKQKREIRTLEVEVRDALSKKAEAESKLKEAATSESKQKSRISSLETLVKELERGVGELEINSDKHTVLQKQIERLEHQLVEVHEQLAIEKQELNQLKSKYWRMERELQNANLDKKIVERDLKEAKDQNNQLTVEMESMIRNTNETKKVHELALLELNSLNENLTVEVVKLSDLVKMLEEKLSSEREKSDDEKSIVKELQKIINKKEEEIANLKQEGRKILKEKTERETQLFETTKRTENFNMQLEKCSQEKGILLEEIDGLKRKINLSEQNQSVLRDACSLIESQLAEFEHLYDVSENKRQSLIEEIEKLTSEMDTIKTECQEAKQIANEEKSYRLLAETKCKKHVEEIENLQRELEGYSLENRDFKTYSSGLANELTEAEQKITDLQIEVKELKRSVEGFIRENYRLKEENSAQLTYLTDLKGSNYKLSQSLAEYKSVNKAVIDQMTLLENLLSEKEMCYKEREIKTDATIRQQTKLIDYLQSKIEETKSKKKTFSDKFFSSNKKENQPPLSIVMNYKDLEHELQKERETSRNLRQEITILKSSTFPDKITSSMNVREQRKLLEQIVQSPQKNELYRQNSVQRMQHNIPHRFETKMCTKATVCSQCGGSIQISRGSSVCKECLIQVHTFCVKDVPRTCGLPQAFAKHYSDSLSKIRDSKGEADVEECIESDLEGYVKIPVKTSWEKYYACLSTKALTIYTEPPNNSSAKIVEKLELDLPDSHGKVVLEPVETEIGIPVASRDLPFVIKAEISPNTTCWPPKCVIFMTLSIEDKDKWYKALNKVFNKPNEKYSGITILTSNEDLDINCLVEISEDLKLLGTDRGLYSYQKDTLSHISGPLHVHQISFVKKLNLAVMIVDENRVLITCDYKHLFNLAECSQIANPTLKFEAINIKNMDGFHTFQTSLGKRDMLCAATARQIIVMVYNLKVREYVLERILDTAEPTSCILFTEHTLIIGADKFFEIDLKTYEAEEFLDNSDQTLLPAIACYKIKSFPLAILEVSDHPIEYLLCYHEFAVFVDQYGRSTRKATIQFNHLPNAFHFANNYLYVIRFTAVDIMKVIENDNVDSYDRHKVDLISPKHLGNSRRGVYVRSGKDVKLVSYRDVTDSISNLEISDEGSENFSFTSSMVRSLDGHLSDDEAETETNTTEKRVKFRTTDL